jgi:lactate dehydrogenase-like 2-hydroxyacid dehydrogenase
VTLLNEDFLARLDRALSAKERRFDRLLEMAGLDPACDLRFADLRGVQFGGSLLDRWDFTGADLQGASFRGAQISNCIFTDARGANLTGSINLGSKQLPDQDILLAKEIVLIGPLKPVVVKGLEAVCTVHKAAAAENRDAFIADHSNVGAIACSATTELIPGSFMARFPKLQIVSSFGVGYDHIDVKWAAAHGVVVTNTPEVLTEEVADTALGLLLCTVREFPQAERFLRAGKWLKQGYPLSKATLRNRTVGMVGMGAIGQAIARRLEAFGVPVVYHTRQPRRELAYRHYPNLVDMARAVDILLVIVPGGPSTQNMINAEVLDALGPDGILINMARGSVVDEPALIKALKEKRIMAAGLDVYVNEPEVPKELIETENVVLFPHLGSASVYTRDKMDQLIVDNISAWAAGKPPLTPVPETPWRSWNKS